MRNWVPAQSLQGVGFYSAGYLPGGAFGGVWGDGIFDSRPALLTTRMFLSVIAAFLDFHGIPGYSTEDMRKGGK